MQQWDREEPVDTLVDLVEKCNLMGVVAESAVAVVAVVHIENPLNILVIY